MRNIAFISTDPLAQKTVQTLLDHSSFNPLGGTVSVIPFMVKLPHEATAPYSNSIPLPIGRQSCLVQANRRIQVVRNRIFDQPQYPNYDAILSIENYRAPLESSLTDFLRLRDEAMVTLYTTNESLIYSATTTSKFEDDQENGLKLAIRKVYFQFLQDQTLINQVKATFLFHRDFPKPGFNMLDFSDLFRKPNLLQKLIHYLAQKYQTPQTPQTHQIDYVYGLESRGYLLAVPLALELGAAFIPIRKAGKLPEPKALSLPYQKEDGQDQFETRQDLSKGNAIIVDDILATGGSLKAAIDLITQTLGHTLIDAIVLRDVPSFRHQAHHLLHPHPIRRVIL